VQAVRWDDNVTEYPTQWKGILSNADLESFLLYNITDDQSESKPILPAAASTSSAVSPAVTRARDIILAQMDEAGDAIATFLGRCGPG
jgi:hypothetical protein